MAAETATTAKKHDIPIGPATVVGQVATVVLALAGAAFAVVQGDHTPETLLALGGAVLTAVTLMTGRYAQSVAKTKADAVSAGAAAAAPQVVVHCCCHEQHAPPD